MNLLFCIAIKISVILKGQDFFNSSKIKINRKHVFGRGIARIDGQAWIR